MNLKERLHQFGIAFDQLVNAFPLFAGYADETISARCYRRNHKKKWRILERVVNVLFFWQTKDGKLAHCELAFEAEKHRHHMPHEYRD